MAFIELSDVQQDEPVPGCKVKTIVAESMNMAIWDLAPGALVPEHSHPQEQVTLVLEGRLELTIDGETRILGPEEAARIGPDQIHKARVIEACRAIDVFHPVRLNYGR